jgi:hypothetical protein
MAKTSTLLDLESLADESLEDIAEAPEFINPPAGDYTLRSVSGEIKSFEQRRWNHEAIDSYCHRSKGSSGTGR